LSCSRSFLAALALALAATQAHAFDVKLWPLFRYARDDERGQLRWSAFGPFMEYVQTPETRDLYVRPFLALHQRRGPTPDDRADICYPLVSSRWTEDHQSFRFLLFTYRTQSASHEAEPEAPSSAYTSRLTVFPFIWYRHDPDDGTGMSVFPFWLDLDDFVGFERVRTVMFPAYLELTEPRVERRFHPFPFYSTVGGEDGDGVRVWPFYGRKDIAGRERSRYVLWPFHVRSEVLVPGYGWERRRVNFPVWSAIDGEARTSRAWGMIAYTHTVDRREDSDVTGSPWPLVVRAKHIGADEYYTWRLVPFYGRSDRDGISSRFYMWPAYRVKRQDTDEFHYERRDAVFLLWRHQTLDGGERNWHERLDTLFPLYRDQDDDGRRFGQAPAILDSLMPENRGILGSWAPLWAFARWDTRPSDSGEGVRDWNLLYGLAAREGGHLLGPWHLEDADGD